MSNMDMSLMAPMIQRIVFQSTYVVGIVTAAAKIIVMNYLNNIVATLQILCAAGIVLRCILVIQKGRENDASWKEIFGQLKKYIFIGILCITISELVTILGGYFTTATP